MDRDSTLSEKSKEPKRIERERLVFGAIKSLQSKQALFTQADVGKELDKSDPKWVERAVKHLAEIGVLVEEPKGQRCERCGRPLGAGPFYGLCEVFPLRKTRANQDISVSP
jgi:hypothetical protein